MNRLKSQTSLFVSLLLLLSFTLQAAETPKEIPLWSGDVPGSEGKTGNEKVRNANGASVVSSVHKPSLTPYLPASDKATGCAVIVAPGGGHRELWMDHEGYNIGSALRDRGIAVFVLKYRLARETNSTYQIDVHSLADMQRAIRLVRSRATEWGIASNRIGVMGFSAGGEVAFLSAMRFEQTNQFAVVDAVDNESAKPNFQALIYPGASRRIEPATNSPPVFLVCGYGDRPDISEGLANVYLKFKQAKVPAELHIYSGSGHGFGFRPNEPKPAGKWLARFEEWLGDGGFLKKP